IQLTDNYAYTDNNDSNAYDYYQHGNRFVRKERQRELKRATKVTLWESYANDYTTPIPVYISLPKYYSELNEKQIISQALQMKQINKEVMMLFVRILHLHLF
ncbi:hypothetical protein RFI_25515, partial [Reticulomyxa filosa]